MTPRQPILFGRVRLEKERGQRGAERQRVECREERREGDRQGKLPVKLPGNAADEATGTKTAVSPQAIAMTAGVTSSMAR